MAYYFLVLMIFISLLLKGLNEFYDFFKIDLYFVLVPVIFLKIILNLSKNRFVFSKPILYFLFFIFTIFFSSLINYGYEDNNLHLFKSIKGVFSYSTWPLFFLLSATEVISKKDSIRLNNLLWVIGYVTAANVLIPVIIYFLTGNLVGELVVEDGSVRSFGFLTDQVGFALVYFVVLSVIKKKYLSTLFFIIAILFTGTRGAIAFAIIALMLAFVFKKQISISSKNIFSLLRRGILLFLIIAIAWVSFKDKISSLVTLRLDSESIDGTSAQRFGAMLSGIKLFLDNPFFGVGIGKFPELVYNSPQLSNNFDYHLSLTKEENMRGYANPQNEFINILVNGGLFSLIIVILFIYNVLKNIRSKMRLMDTTSYHIAAFIFITSAVFFIQTTIYIFNVGIISFIILFLLGRGSSKSIN
jgi:O-antigen ligase